MRAISLMRRRTRFRATALRPCRGATTAIRARAAGDGAENRSKSWPPRWPPSRRPARIARRISRPDRTRAARGKRWPSRAERPLPASSLTAEGVTDREPAATLSSPARQDSAPRLGLHPGPESMIADALSVRRLAVCGLPHRTSPKTSLASSRLVAVEPGSLDGKPHSVNSSAVPFVDTSRGPRLRSTYLSSLPFLMNSSVRGWS